MKETCGNIKTTLAELQGRGLSSTAKLVAILEACGVTDKDDLAAMLEIGGSTLRTAKAALKNERSKSSSARNQALENEQNARNQAETLENERSNSSVPSRAHATKELPSEVSSYLEVNTPLAPQRGRTRGERLSLDWQLPEDWRMWARTNFPASTDAQVFDQADQFRDYWIAKPGAQACKLDWEATWRNWCRRGLSAAGTVRKPQYTGSYRQSAEIIPYKPMPQPAQGMSREALEKWALELEASHG